MEPIEEVKNYRGRKLAENRDLMNLGKLEEYRQNCFFIAGMTKAIDIIEARRCK